jgi:hypothetical protein
MKRDAMAVENRGYIFVAIIMMALASASQMFSGQMGALLGIVPTSVSGPIMTATNAASGSLSFFGMVVFILAFVTRP